jgi:nicotinamide mononucleotide transporter
MLEKYNIYFEILGFSTGLSGVYLTAKQNILCFPIGLISLFCTYILMQNEGYFANAMLQFVFAAFLLLGWYHWNKDPAEPLSVTSIKRKPWLFTIVFCSISGISFGYYMSLQTGSQSPYLDGITTALSIAAQFLIIRKKLQNWYLWIAANAIYVVMYLISGLYIYTALYAIYLGLAVSGLNSWRKSMKTEHI